MKINIYIYISDLKKYNLNIYYSKSTNTAMQNINKGAQWPCQQSICICLEWIVSQSCAWLCWTSPVYWPDSEHACVLLSRCFPGLECPAKWMSQLLEAHLRFGWHPENKAYLTERNGLQYTNARYFNL